MSVVPPVREPVLGDLQLVVCSSSGVEVTTHHSEQQHYPFLGLPSGNGPQSFPKPNLAFWSGVIFGVHYIYIVCQRSYERGWVTLSISFSFLQLISSFRFLQKDIVVSLTNNAGGILRQLLDLQPQSRMVLVQLLCRVQHCAACLFISFLVCFSGTISFLDASEVLDLFPLISSLVLGFSLFPPSPPCHCLLVGRFPQLVMVCFLFLSFEHSSYVQRGRKKEAELIALRVYCQIFVLV